MKKYVFTSLLLILLVFASRLIPASSLIFQILTFLSGVFCLFYIVYSFIIGDNLFRYISMIGLVIFTLICYVLPLNNIMEEGLYTFEKAEMDMPLPSIFDELKAKTILSIPILYTVLLTVYIIDKNMFQEN